jgi:hypothetical protein
LSTDKVLRLQDNFALRIIDVIGGGVLNEDGAGVHKENILILPSLDLGAVAWAPLYGRLGLTGWGAG